MTTATHAEQIGRRYDESSPMSAAFNDGQAHMSYWYGEQDDTPMSVAAQRLTSKVAGVLGLRPGEHLLDAGCGPGGPALQIAGETGARVTGITVSGFEVREAQRRAAEQGLAGQVRFQHGDWMALPFDGGTFDAVLAVETLQNAPNLGAALREFHRVLRPGGGIAIGDYTWVGADPADAEQFAASFGINPPPSLAGWTGALADAGFAVEEYTQCGPRVFGMGAKFAAAADDMREALAARFGADAVAGLKEGMRAFFEVGPDRIGYAIVAARKPSR